MIREEPTSAREHATLPIALGRAIAEQHDPEVGSKTAITVSKKSGAVHPLTGRDEDPTPVKSSDC